jgi:hypothetical protein
MYAVLSVTKAIVIRILLKKSCIVPELVTLQAPVGDAGRGEPYDIIISGKPRSYADCIEEL